MNTTSVLTVVFLGIFDPFLTIFDPPPPKFAILGLLDPTPKNGIFGPPRSQIWDQFAEPPDTPSSGSKNNHPTPTRGPRPDPSPHPTVHAPDKQASGNPGSFCPDRKRSGCLYYRTSNKNTQTIK